MRVCVYIGVVIYRMKVKLIYGKLYLFMSLACSSFQFLLVYVCVCVCVFNFFYWYWYQSSLYYPVCVFFIGYVKMVFF